MRTVGACLLGVPLLAVVIFVAGCRDLGVDPSGKLACSLDRHQCPNGYECKSDNRCWRLGTPGADAAGPDSSSLDASSVDMLAPVDLGDDHASDGAAPADQAPGLCSEGATRTCDRDGLLGLCATGSETCAGGRWGPCSVSPAAADRCDVAGDDSNCNGTTNDGCACTNGATQACGPSATVGICKRGTQTCKSGAWSACVGGAFGKARDCTSALDNDCDGVADNTIDSVCQCAPVNGSRACGTHPQDGTGPCHAGSQTCVAGAGNATSAWGNCTGSVGPLTNDTCTLGDDSNCNGAKNEGCGGAKLSIAAQSGSSVNFGSVPFGTRKMETFVVTNIGLMSSSALVVTLNGSGFSLGQPGTNDCLDGVTVLAPMATCSITVTFDPPSGGPHQGSLSVSAAAGGITDTLNLVCDTPAYCGDAIKTSPEECDLGTAKNTGAYGGCTSTCTKAGYCGDGKVNGPESCDSGASNANVLNSCNPECSGIVAVKLLKVSPPVAATFGGVAGADNICRANFGTSYKALVVDGSTRVANLGSQLIYPLYQTDWVLKKYMLYRNDGNKDVFLTDAGALLGIRNGVHVDLLNSIYGYSGGDLLDAWSGTDRDWVSDYLENCSLFTTTDPGSTSGWIALYVTGASEFPTNNSFYRCDYQAHILCAQQ